MADDDLIEAEGSIAFGNTSMFGDADEAPESEGFGAVVSDDESEQDLLGIARVRPFGKTWEFDFEAGEFMMRGSGSQVSVVDGKTSFAQWAMAVLHTERYSALVYSGQIGVEFESLVRSSGGAEVASALLLGRVEEALSVHDRFESIESFSASVDGDYVLINMTINTSDGAVDIEGTIYS